MSSASPLGPIDPSSVNGSGIGSDETEKKAPWVVRKLAGSITGRIVMSSYESLRAAGTSVVCLSPWGDSSPLLLPCIRFRDLVAHAVIAGTGGVAAVAAPVMGPVSDLVLDTIGDSILVEVGLHAGFEVTTKVTNDLVIEHAIKHVIPSPSARLETTGVKTLLITLKYKHTIEDAALGFYRSSLHADSSLFANVKDYLATEKGWFSPYLFASGRRPVIPRSMKPDVIFCHGPFLSGDYRIGETLVKESASLITLCQEIPKPEDSGDSLKPPSASSGLDKMLQLPRLSKYLPQSRSRTPSPEPQLASVPRPPNPRRLAMLIVGIKPHRKLWTTSARPGESCINYLLLNGCPTIVLPAKVGAPLVAWDGLTLDDLQKLELPAQDGSGGEKLKGVVDVLFEYMTLCVDWDRVVLQGGDGDENLANDEASRKAAVKNAITLLLFTAVQSKDSKQVKEEVDADRSGIVILRIP